eukprot:TRINITY_DN3325_c0_g1_i2.p1 TRINITY_DN3325_c0_g1~~TRINITY_DN3325_c0_g1_i2.p1  ORF type:complete len:141 (-),score=35.36 TRINITY_DN3325_c0_g1_i2:93-515(-)
MNKFLVLLCLAVSALSSPQGGKQVDVTFVGDLTDTEHDVGGKVYILDQDTLVIDDFSYDGNGFGVYINVATKGRNLRSYAKNRIDVPYPSGSEGEPIEDEYTGDGQLVIDLKQVGVKARDIKWLSVWCTVFEMSFGHLEF